MRRAVSWTAYYHRPPTSACLSSVNSLPFLIATTGHMPSLVPSLVFFINLVLYPCSFVFPDGIHPVVHCRFFRTVACAMSVVI